MSFCHLVHFVFNFDLDKKEHLNYICFIVFFVYLFFLILQTSAERENDLRKNEIRSLEDKQGKDNQVRNKLMFHRLHVT